MKFYVYRTKELIRNSEEFRFGYRWRLRARNGKVIASGEFFRTKRACVESVSLLRDRMMDDTVPIVFLESPDDAQ